MLIVIVTVCVLVSFRQRGKNCLRLNYVGNENLYYAQMCLENC